MNKYDWILVSSLLIIIGLTFVFLYKKDSDNKLAKVYYENEVILTIDLTLKEEKEYIVKGYNGDVTIKTKDGKIKVDSEKSPLNLCSKQGYISSSNEVIVCLPNKIIIKIEDKETVDTVIE